MAYVVQYDNENMTISKVLKKKVKRMPWRNGLLISMILSLIYFGTIVGHYFICRDLGYSENVTEQIVSDITDGTSVSDALEAFCLEMYSQ